MSCLAPDADNRRGQNTKEERPETRKVCLYDPWCSPRMLGVIYNERGIVDGTSWRVGIVESDGGRDGDGDRGRKGGGGETGGGSGGGGTRGAGS